MSKLYLGLGPMVKRFKGRCFELALRRWFDTWWGRNLQSVYRINVNPQYCEEFGSSSPESQQWPGELTCWPYITWNWLDHSPCLQICLHDTSSQLAGPGLQWAVVPRIIICLFRFEVLYKSKVLRFDIHSWRNPLNSSMFNLQTLSLHVNMLPRDQHLN